MLQLDFKANLIMTPFHHGSRCRPHLVSSGVAVSDDPLKQSRGSSQTGLADKLPVVV